MMGRERAMVRVILVFALLLRKECGSGSVFLCVIREREERDLDMCHILSGLGRHISTFNRAFNETS